MIIVIYLLMVTKFTKFTKVTKFKAKYSKLIKYSMCLGGLSKYYNKNSRKETGLYGNFYDFSVDYSVISNDKIHDSHAYLMKKNNIV